MPKVTTSLFGDIAILPYPADPPVRETLEYLTDLQVAYDATENRVPLRTMPRQLINCRVIVQQNKLAEEFNTLSGALRAAWAIPLWFEEQMVGPLSAGTSVIACQTSNYDFRDDSLGLLYSPNGLWELIEIQTVSPYSLTIYGTLSQSFEMAWVMPVRRGWLVESADRSISTAHAEVNLRMMVDDTPSIAAAVPEQFLGSDIYYDPMLMSSGEVSGDISQRQEILDETLGVIDRRTPWTRSQYVRTKLSRIRTAAQARAFRQFFSRRQGRYRSFWYPTFEENARVASVGTVVSSLLIVNDSFIHYATARTHIAVEAGGTWYPRTVSSYAPSGANVQLNLSSALNVPASSITRVSYLGLNRLDSDRVEINWVGNKVAQIAYPVRELTP